MFWINISSYWRGMGFRFKVFAMLKRTKTKMPKTKTEVRATRRRGTYFIQTNHVSNENAMFLRVFWGDFNNYPLMWGLFHKPWPKEPYVNNQDFTGESLLPAVGFEYLKGATLVVLKLVNDGVTFLCSWSFRVYIQVVPTQICVSFTPYDGGRWTHGWRSYFSKGLVQPPTRYEFMEKTWVVKL